MCCCTSFVFVFKKMNKIKNWDSELNYDTTELGTAVRSGRE